MDCSVILLALLLSEFWVRAWLELRERRMTQLRGGFFALLRLIPLVNDIVPLPESRSIAGAVGNAAKDEEFVQEHEKAHSKLHHGILRNLLKVILLCLAVGFLLFLVVRLGLPWWQSVLWLHLVAVPVKPLYHWYCWNQEYEADKTAFEKLGKKSTRDAMRELVTSEIPFTPLFALFYREHPTAALRSQRLLNR